MWATTKGNRYWILLVRGLTMFNCKIIFNTYIADEQWRKHSKPLNNAHHGVLIVRRVGLRLSYVASKHKILFNILYEVKKNWNGVNLNSTLNNKKGQGSSAVAGII